MCSTHLSSILISRSSECHFHGKIIRTCYWFRNYFYFINCDLLFQTKQYKITIIIKQLKLGLVICESVVRALCWVSDDVVRAGPRKKILNYIRISGSSNVDHVSELQLALLSEQQSVHTLKEKIKLDRENDLKNQQIIQVRRREQGGWGQGTLSDRT